MKCSQNFGWNQLSCQASMFGNEKWKRETDDRADGYVLTSASTDGYSAPKLTCQPLLEQVHWHWVEKTDKGSISKFLLRKYWI